MSGEPVLAALPPGSLLIAGALLFPFLRGRLRQAWLLALPALSFLHLLAQPLGTPFELFFSGFPLTPIRIDRLSLVWGYIFHLAAFLAALYALHVKDAWQHVAAFVYAGAAIGAVFAGDLFTLFVYWEVTAFTSVFLIWARRSERAYGAGIRYLVMQVGSGVILLAGIVLRVHAGGSLAFEQMTLRDPAGGVAWPSLLIFLAFGIKAAFPLLHGWLEDAYPEATVTGTVFLSAFTTKMAIYALARGFPGTEELIWIGAAMTAFPIFFAVIVNDLRRVLAYSLNNQLGFMVVGVGLGTEMSLNGTAAHAFAHILYKALLFMAMGAVLHRTGTCKGSELGGLYKTMPWTTAFCIVGALSISAFPLTSGFVSKSLILTAAADQHYTVVWLVLLFASAGVFHHSGIKIPYFAFFAHDSGKRPAEAPRHMLLAMGVTAALCLAIGVFPDALYGILPFPADYEPYTTGHVISQLQLLCFSALAFTTLNLLKVYPPELRSTVLDVDWLYRRAVPATAAPVARFAWQLWTVLLDRLRRAGRHLLAAVERLHGPGGALGHSWSVSGIARITVAMLGFYLLLCFLWWQIG